MVPPLLPLNPTTGTSTGRTQLKQSILKSTRLAPCDIGIVAIPLPAGLLCGKHWQPRLVRSGQSLALRMEC